jgi:hypothetical protein
MLGTNYPTIIDGTTYLMCGTSASSPLFASFVSLLNGLRISNDSSVTEGVGWLNPMLWAAGNNVTFAGTDTSIFTDVTSGDNKCCENQHPEEATCCSSGFTTTTGWDPITGWGEITYSNFVALNGFESSVSGSGSGGGSNDLSTTAIALISVFSIIGAVVAVLWFLGCMKRHTFTGEEEFPSQTKQQQLSSTNREEAGVGKAGLYIPPSAPTVVSRQPQTTQSPMW